jgi:hypothetical protein
MKNTLYDKDGNHYELKNKDRKSPIRGSISVYLKPACNRKMKDEFGREWQISLIDLSVQLTAKQMQVFLRMCLHIDELNIIYGGLSKISEPIGVHNRYSLSKIKSALIHAKAISISKIGNIMINPFIILPKGEKGFYAQQIWKKINYDNNAYFDGIEDMISSLGW